MQRRGVFLLTILVALVFSQLARTDSPTTTVPGDPRPSVVYRPASLPMTTKVPLVVLLHGSGSSAESIMGWSRFNRLADSRGFVVASLSSGTSNNWLAAEWMNSEADVDYMRSELKLLETAENIDPARVFVVGFSAGGSMAYRAACELADQIAGIGVVSSSFAMTHCTPKQPVTVMGIFGTADGVVKFNGTSRVEAPSASIARWRDFNSCPSASTMSGAGVVTTQTWQPCSAGTAVAYTVVEGGKHTWSGANGLPSSSPNAQLDATVALWEFLSAHPMQAAAVPPPSTAAFKSVALRRVGKAKTDLVVAVKISAAMRGNLSLTKSGSIVASRSLRLSTPGRVSVVVHFKRALVAGRYVVKLALVDDQGLKRTLSRAVTLR